MSDPDAPSDAAPDAPALDPDARIRADAEQVRTWLVTVRGGAPFLSPADDHLLLSWLQAGIPAAAIVAAIDTVAERRRQRRARRRLSLRDCRKVVEAGPRASRRGPAGPEHFQAPAPPAARGALDDLIDEIAATPVPDSLRPAHDALLAALRGLPAGAHVDEVGRAAAAAVTAFHDAAWNAATPEHDALRERAAAQLAGMRSALKPREWTELVEEVARDLLRQRTPAVSARRVWDRLAG
ncbi:MAG: hypothetical protein H6742_21100 [Alphaproteobacteria bacterium]|nr:hypothetical protein [Alphaproteobacteria bacterium]